MKTGPVDRLLLLSVTISGKSVSLATLKLSA
jgi:hypothetical protein